MGVPIIQGKGIKDMATLRELRHAKGWSQMELATRAGISLQSVARIESGRSRKIIPLMRRALATALNVDPDEIIVGDTRDEQR